MLWCTNNVDIAWQASCQRLYSCVNGVKAEAPN